MGLLSDWLFGKEAVYRQQLAALKQKCADLKAPVQKFTGTQPPKSKADMQALMQQADAQAEYRWQMAEREKEHDAERRDVPKVRQIRPRVR